MFPDNVGEMAEETTNEVQTHGSNTAVDHTTEPEQDQTTDTPFDGSNDDEVMESMIRNASNEDVDGASLDPIFNEHDDDEAVNGFVDDADEQFNMNPDFSDEELEDENKTEETPDTKESEQDDRASDTDNGEAKRLDSVRIRIQPENEVEAQALSMRKRNPDLTLEECLERAKENLGVAGTDNHSEDDLEGERPDGKDVYQELLDEIQQLEEDEVKAAEDLDFAESAKIGQKIRKLSVEANTLRIRQEQERQQKEQEEQSLAEKDFYQREEQSKENAVTLYPDVTNPESLLVKTMVQIDNALKEADDDLHYSPDKHLKIAQMAARKLSIPPATAKVSEEKVARQRKVASVAPAGGSMRTTPKNQEDVVGRALDTIDKASLVCCPAGESFEISIYPQTREFYRSYTC